MGATGNGAAEQGGRGVTEEQLAEYEAWAQAWSRVESVGARRVLELVAEVRRLKAAAVPDEHPVLVSEFSEQQRDELRREMMRRMHRISALPVEQPAPLPPFPGILAGITAADVYGVQV